MKVYEPSPARRWNGVPYRDNPNNRPYDNQGKLIKRVRHKN